MKDFFGFGGYKREAEGYFSSEHLIFVTALMIIMIAFAVIFGLKNKRGSDKQKNLPIFWVVLLPVPVLWQRAISLKPDSRLVCPAEP